MRDLALITLFATFTLTCLFAWGDSVLFGHNVTPTTYTLSKGTVTVGNYVAAVGITDHLTIGSSPWLYFSYNMYSAVVRTRGCLVRDGDQCSYDWGVQALYLQTGHFGKDSYKMTAAGASFVVKKDVTDFYSVNGAVNLTEFFDETSPYSLRREPYNDDNYQVTVSALQEIRLPAGFGVLIETGILGLNYIYPEIHVGISMSHRSSFSLLQIGFSQTYTSGTLAHMFSTS